jgi:hypothetical protein
MAYTWQYVNDNKTAVKQHSAYGDTRNLTEVYVVGNENDNHIVQDGSDNYTYLEVMGDGNVALSDPTSIWSDGIRQIGDQNISNAYQWGNMNTLTIDQLSNFNNSMIIQNGNSNSSSIIQQ